MLHPDKTKMLLFSTFSKGEGVEIFCNNNKDLLLDPSLIKQISLVNSTDEIPAVKFLGIFIDSTTFLLNIIPPLSEKNFLKLCIHFAWPKISYLAKI